MIHIHRQTDIFRALDNGLLQSREKVVDLRNGLGSVGWTEAAGPAADRRALGLIHVGSWME